MDVNARNTDSELLINICLELLEVQFRKVDLQQSTSWHGYELVSPNQRILDKINNPSFIQSAFQECLNVKCGVAAASCIPFHGLHWIAISYRLKRKRRSRRRDLDSTGEKNETIFKDVFAMEPGKPVFFSTKATLKTLLEDIFKKIFQAARCKRLWLENKHLPSLVSLALNGATKGKLRHYPDKEEELSPEKKTSSKLAKLDEIANHVHVVDSGEKKKRKALADSAFQSDKFLKLTRLQIKSIAPVNIEAAGGSTSDAGKCEMELIIDSPSIVSLAQYLIRDNLIRTTIPPYLASFVGGGVTKVKCKSVSQHV